MNYRRWTEEELQLLKDAAGEGLFLEDIARLLSKTPLSVEQKARREGVKIATPKKHGASWSDSDIEMLRKHGPRLELPALAKMLQRTEEAVRGKAKKEHVKIKNAQRRPWIHWSEKEERIILKYWRSESAAQIVERLGGRRSLDAVKLRASILGASKRPEPSRQADALILKHYKEQGADYCAKRLAFYSADDVEARAKELEEQIEKEAAAIVAALSQ